MIFKKIYQLGDKIEDKIRGKLSHYPIIYAFVGGAGIIIFWRGVWHTADSIMELFFTASNSSTSVIASQLPWWDGPLSIFIGTVLLLAVGLFVSSFIGNEIIISGLKGEKKLVEKAEQEIEREISVDTELEAEMKEITSRLNKINKLLENKK